MRPGNHASKDVLGLFFLVQQLSICIVLFFISLLFSYSASAQMKNAGSLISYKKITGGIEGKTGNAIFDVHVYNDNIIRVRISKGKTFRNFSYALASNDIPSFSNIPSQKKTIASLFQPMPLMRRFKSLHHSESSSAIKKMKLSMKMCREKILAPHSMEIRSASIKGCRMAKDSSAWVKRWGTWTGTAPALP